MNTYLHMLLLAIVVATASCQNTKKTEKEEEDIALVDTVALDTTSDAPHIRNLAEKFVDAYNSKNNEAVNALIHPEYGVIILHRPGAVDWFEKVPAIDFKKPIPAYHEYSSTTPHDYHLEFGQLPVYACDTESWSKTGFFVDTINSTNIIMPIAEQLSEFEDVELEPDYRSQIRMAEENSFRVILTTPAPLVFHVKKVDGKWYVTVLDRAYGDCSA